jgi:hypothetical protein
MKTVQIEHATLYHQKKTWFYQILHVAEYSEILGPYGSVVPCCSVDGYQYFRGTCYFCLHLPPQRWRQQMPHKFCHPSTKFCHATSQKDMISMKSVQDLKLSHQLYAMMSSWAIIRVKLNIQHFGDCLCLYHKGMNNICWPTTWCLPLFPKWYMRV